MAVCVSLGDAGIDSGSISHLCSSWLHVADALRFSKPSTGDQVEDTIGALLKEVFTPPAISSQSEWPSRRSAIIAMTAYLLIRTQLSCTVQRIVRSFVKVEKDTASESQLRGHFVLLVSHIYDYVSGVLREACGVQPGKSDTCGSLPDLVDDVLSLVYGQARFVILRREMSALLMGQQSPGSLSDTLNSVFRLYRAQVLESHIRLGQHLIQQRCASSVTRLQNAWNHRWLLDPLTVRCNRVTSPGLDIVGIAQFIREFGCVDVEVEDNMSYLSVGSALSKLRDTSMMELVLDGRLRAYRELPSGLSGWSVGDYAAEFCDGGLDIDLFAIEGRKTEGRGSGERWLTRVCRIRLLLSLEQRVNSAMLSRNGRDMVVVVHGAILAATYLPPYSRGQSTGAEEFLQLSIEDRAAIHEFLCACDAAAHDDGRHPDRHELEPGAGHAARAPAQDDGTDGIAPASAHVLQQPPLAVIWTAHGEHIPAVRRGAGWRDRGADLHRRLLPMGSEHAGGTSDLWLYLPWDGAGHAVRATGRRRQNGPDVRPSRADAGLRRRGHQHLHVRVAAGHHQGGAGDQVVGVATDQPVLHDLPQLLHVGGHVPRGRRHVRVDPERHRPPVQQRATPVVLHLPPHEPLHGPGCPAGRRLRLHHGHQDFRRCR
ncbi:hypothetical protein ON010_g16595 [Phytophthora cinnamomi]|nr:hypothetical protein ON010_g16595 [Phytophthora cinnamomi]